MTRVEAGFDGDRITSLTVKGHTGYAEAGEDLVCAAVSAVTQTAVLGIKAFSPTASIRIDEERALIEMTLSDESESAQAILKTALLGLEDIAAGMPEFVKVLHKNRRWKT